MVTFVASKISIYCGLWWFSVWLSASVFSFSVSVLYHLEVFVSISKTANLMPIFFVSFIHSILLIVKLQLEQATFS